MQARMERVRQARFNEAPIHESGKFSSLERGNTGNARFNEAPIHESGKSSEGG